MTTLTETQTRLAEAEVRPEREELDRVRGLTAAGINRSIDQQAEHSVWFHASRQRDEIDRRIAELDSEWDFERTLEAEAATMGLIGVALGVIRGRGWLLMPGMVAAMVLFHAVFGPYPMLPLFRRLGVRTRHEIEQEKYALKVLRGDFETVAESDRIERAKAAWRAVQR